MSNYPIDIIFSWIWPGTILTAVGATFTLRLSSGLVSDIICIFIFYKLAFAFFYFFNKEISSLPIWMSKPRSSTSSSPSMITGSTRTGTPWDNCCSFPFWDFYWATLILLPSDPTTILRSRSTSLSSFSLRTGSTRTGTPCARFDFDRASYSLV